MLRLDAKMYCHDQLLSNVHHAVTKGNDDIEVNSRFQNSTLMQMQYIISMNYTIINVKIDGM